MSNPTTFVLGVGAGLVAWYATRQARTSPIVDSTTSTSSPSPPPTPSLTPPTRNGSRDATTRFTLVTYPRGVDGPKKLRWFTSDHPIRWDQARDHLAEVGLIDLRAISPRELGYWKLVTSPEAFKESKAEPLPHQPRRDARVKQHFTTEGRRILRDGEPILFVDRIDLGNQRYAISPHHADLLTQRMVRLLNKHGARL